MSGVKQFDTEETSLRDLEEATGLSRSSLYNAFGDKQATFLMALELYHRRLAEAATPPKEEDACKAIAAMLERRTARLEDPTHPPGCLLANALAERGGAGDSVAGALAAVVSTCEERLYETIRRGQRARTISYGFSFELSRESVAFGLDPEAHLGSLRMDHRWSAIAVRLQRPEDDDLKQETISPSEDPRALARFFIGVSQAMALMSKASGDPSVARYPARLHERTDPDHLSRLLLCGAVRGDALGVG